MESSNSTEKEKYPPVDLWMELCSIKNTIFKPGNDPLERKVKIYLYPGIKRLYLGSAYVDKFVENPEIDKSEDRVKMKEKVEEIKEVYSKL